MRCMDPCNKVFARFQGKTECGFNSLAYLVSFDLINEITINLIGQVLM